MLVQSTSRGRGSDKHPMISNRGLRKAREVNWNWLMSYIVQKSLSAGAIPNWWSAADTTHDRKKTVPAVRTCHPETLCTKCGRLSRVVSAVIV